MDGSNSPGYHQAKVFHVTFLMKELADDAYIDPQTFWMPNMLYHWTMAQLFRGGQIKELYVLNLFDCHAR